MTETIFSRVARLLSARVEDSIDRMEQAGGVAVMREAIREVDRAIDDVRADHEAAAVRRLQAARQQKMLHERCGQLGEKAKFALAESREDLAQAAVSRQIDFEQEAGKLTKVQEGAHAEEVRLEESLVVLKARKLEMEDRLAALIVSKADAPMGSESALHPKPSVETKVARAEQAFDRAMGGSGGAGFTRADAQTIQRVAEIDSLQKNAAVAERMMKLKQSA